MSHLPHENALVPSPAEQWAERIVTAEMRAQDPLDRMEQLDWMIHASRELTLTQLRERYPFADENELQIRLAARLYGRDFTLRWFDWDPQLQGW
ncbi:MAG: hypothetical protein SGI72_15835 [Planctomycetota bacterium]|nr:hypothetical protein [Planctomycetota bacterium]